MTEPTEPEPIEPEVIEPDKVEYFDPTPAFNEERVRYDQPRVYTYQSSGVSCCSGCGCALAALVLLGLTHFSSLFSGLVMVIAAAVLSRFLLEVVGVRRWSKAYVYAIIPLFFVLTNTLLGVVRAQQPYGWREIIAGTLIVWLFVFVASRNSAQTHFPEKR